MRENEYKRVLLDHAIKQKKITLPGYQRAYSIIEDMHEDFSMRISEEAVDKYPDDLNAIASYTEEKNRNMLREMINGIWDRC